MNGEQGDTATTIVIPVAMVLAGLAAYSAMDAVMKGLSIALGAYNALFWRYAGGVIIASLLYLPRRKPWPARQVRRLFLIRGVVTAIMAFAFFWGLARTPLAEGIALSFIAPLIALYLAAVLLGERIGKVAIIASLLGLAGVGVILAGKMGDGRFDRDAMFGVAAILFSAVLYAWNLILQRQQALVAGPVAILFFQNIIVFAIFACFAPFLAAPPPADLWPEIALSTLFAIAALLLISWGYARAEAQHLVSLEYSAFLWAALFGWYFFAEPLTLATLAGTVLIVSGCLLVAWRRPKKAELIEGAPL